MRRIDFRRELNYTPEKKEFSSVMNYSHDKRLEQRQILTLIKINIRKNQRQCLIYGISITYVSH